MRVSLRYTSNLSARTTLSAGELLRLTRLNVRTLVVRQAKRSPDLQSVLLEYALQHNIL